MLITYAYTDTYTNIHTHIYIHTLRDKYVISFVKKARGYSYYI